MIRFGTVREITAVDYVQEVNKAGDDIFVVLHLYRQVHDISIYSMLQFINCKIVITIGISLSYTVPDSVQAYY